MPTEMTPPDADPEAAARQTMPEPVVLRLPAHAPLSLDDPDSRWLVLTGEVTVFALQPGSAASADAPRIFVATLMAGSLLCGVGQSDFGLRLIAVGTAETTLRVLDTAAFLAEENGPQRLCAGIVAWSRALAEGVARSMAPRPVADIAITKAGGLLQALPRTVAVSRGEPVWVRLGEGPWLLFGLEPLAGFVPLPAEAWLTGSGPVQPVGALEALAEPDWVAGLAAFNQSLLSVLPSAVALDAAEELNRVRLRQARDDEEERGALAGFAAILGNPTEILEADDAEPSVTVFRIAAGHLGVRAKRPVRVRRADVDAASSNAELARASGLRLRPVQLPADWWRSDFGVLLAEHADGDPVALVPDARGYRMHRAGAPQGVRVGAAEAAAIDLAAQTLLRPLPRKALEIMELLTVGMARSGGDAVLLGLAMLIGALLGQAVPMATGVAFSFLIPGGHLSELAQLSTALVLVAGVAWVVKIASEIARQRIEARAGPALHAAIWDRVLRLPLAQFARQTVGETSARATAAIGFAAQLRAFAFVLASGIAIVLSSALVMVVSQPSAALIALGMLVLQLLVANYAGWLQARAFASGEALSGLADAMVFQIVAGIVKLRLTGAEARARRVWSTRFAEMRRRMTSARRIGNGYDAFAAGFTVVSTAAAFLIIAILQANEPGQPAPSLATVMSFIAAFGLMSAAGTQIAKVAFALWFLLPTRKFIQPLLEALPESDSGRVDPGRLAGTIEITNVTFRYPGADQPVFAGLTVRIEAGEFVAIVGRSGVGKSTLVRLLLGLEDPLSGAIYVDGQDIRGLDTFALRSQVATVLQACRVPPGSIRDAVRGLSTASDAEIWQALHRASLANDVRAMPMALETMLTDASRVLSGGQVQRLLLARAMLQRPAILIMDEATSALDNLTQAATMRAVRRMPCTRIVVAHRLSTIRRADRIIVLDAGRVVESGTFAQLIERKTSAFARQYAEEARWEAASRASGSAA
jgi:ABC-type bacteriocin/lantibiotic exporter with double-glycine peptidase domain